MSNKEFVGWVAVKEVEANGSKWEYTQISFKLDDLEKMKNFTNEKGYINLKLNRSQKGKEYLEIDTFGLNQQQAPAAAPQPQAAPDQQAAPDHGVSLDDGLEVPF